MIKLYTQVELWRFDAWGGASDTLAVLNYSQCEELECIISDWYPDGLDETQLNDILWFERDWISECLGYEDWEQLYQENKENGEI